MAVVAQIAYPGGTGSPSIIGADCKIYRGWPVPTLLDRDLNAGKIHLSVFAHDIERRTTRHAQEWRSLPVTPPSLTLAVSDGTITAGGTPSSPLNAAAIVDDRAYVYPVQPGDTLEVIAAALAAMINADRPAAAEGPSITISGAYRIAARVGAVGTVVKEIRRQKRSFQLTCWCPSPEARDAIASALDAELADIDYLTLPDGTAGRLLYERTAVTDRSVREGLYRRDLFYSVEYGTTLSRSAAQIVAELLNLADAYGNPIPPPPFDTLPWERIDTPWDQLGTVWSKTDKPIDQLDTKWEEIAAPWEPADIDEIGTNWEDTGTNWENKE